MKTKFEEYEKLNEELRLTDGAKLFQDLLKYNNHSCQVICKISKYNNSAIKIFGKVKFTTIDKFEIKTGDAEFTLEVDDINRYHKETNLYDIYTNNDVYFSLTFE